MGDPTTNEDLKNLGNYPNIREKLDEIWKISIHAKISMKIVKIAGFIWFSS